MNINQYPQKSQMWDSGKHVQMYPCQIFIRSLESKSLFKFLAQWKTSQMATAHLNAQAPFQGNKLHLHLSTTNGRRDQLDLLRKSSRRRGFTLTCTRLKSKFQLLLIFFVILMFILVDLRSVCMKMICLV